MAWILTAFPVLYVVCVYVKSEIAAEGYPLVIVGGCGRGIFIVEGLCCGEWGLGAGEVESFAFIRPEFHLPFGLPLL